MMITYSHRTSSSSSKKTKTINWRGNCSHSLIFLFCVAMQIHVCCSGNISGVTSVALLQQGSPLLFPINNRHLVHYYADIIIFVLTSVYGNYYFVMGNVCITVNLLIDHNNILYLSAISRMSYLIGEKWRNFRQVRKYFLRLIREIFWRKYSCISR